MFEVTNVSAWFEPCSITAILWPPEVFVCQELKGLLMVV